MANADRVKLPFLIAETVRNVLYCILYYIYYDIIEHIVRYELGSWEHFLLLAVY